MPEITRLLISSAKAVALKAARAPEWASAPRMKIVLDGVDHFVTDGLQRRLWMSAGLLRARRLAEPAREVNDSTSIKPPD